MAHTNFHTPFEGRDDLLKSMNFITLERIDIKDGFDISYLEKLSFKKKDYRRNLLRNDDNPEPIKHDDPNFLSLLKESFNKDGKKVKINKIFPLLDNPEFLKLIIKEEIPFSSIEDEELANKISDGLLKLTKTKGFLKGGNPKGGQNYIDKSNEFAREIGPILDKIDEDGYTSLKKKASYLNNKNIKIKVCGIINSKGALLEENGIDLINYKSSLQNNLESIDREKLKLFRQQTNMTNPIIVDCTSSQSVAEAYIDFFKAGYHVVAANKKANTLNLSYYKEIKATATNLQRQYHYETNVGAGLPVIDTFKNLLNAGDSLIQFQGILSGSMSYIFGKLDSGMKFSEAVTKAKNKGFTEPDPRDDLSGMDIARKVLIIARESGLKLELKDVQIDSLLTNELLSCKDSSEFMKQLPSIDSQISDKVQAASDKNCVLRFVGNIENSKCSVKIEEVQKSSALYSIKDGENAIAIYSNYYHPIPMVLRGYGAGAEVTAAGIFSDMIKILPVKSSFI